MNLTEISLPFGAAFMLSSTVVGIVLWVFANFERKMDAKHKHDAIHKRVEEQEKILYEVASDVSYIRGRLEPK